MTFPTQDEIEAALEYYGHPDTPSFHGEVLNRAYQHAHDELQRMSQLAARYATQEFAAREEIRGLEAVNALAAERFERAEDAAELEHLKRDELQDRLLTSGWRAENKDLRERLASASSAYKAECNRNTELRERAVASETKLRASEQIATALSDRLAEAERAESELRALYKETEDHVTALLRERDELKNTLAAERAYGGMSTTVSVAEIARLRECRVAAVRERDEARDERDDDLALMEHFKARLLRLEQAAREAHTDWSYNPNGRVRSRFMEALERALGPAPAAPASTPVYEEAGMEDQESQSEVWRHESRTALLEEACRRAAACLAGVNTSARNQCLAALAGKPEAAAPVACDHSGVGRPGCTFCDVRRAPDADAAEREHCRKQASEWASKESFWAGEGRFYAVVPEPTALLLAERAAARAECEAERRAVVERYEQRLIDLHEAPVPEASEREHCADEARYLLNRTCMQPETNDVAALLLSERAAVRAECEAEIERLRLRIAELEGRVA